MTATTTQETFSAWKVTRAQIERQAENAARQYGWAFLVKKNDGTMIVIMPREYSAAMLRKCGAKIGMVYCVKSMVPTYEATQGKQVGKRIEIFTA